jgi:hypothetical protein
VESIYRGLGLDEAALPPLHDAGAYTSVRSAEEPPFGRSYAEYHDGVDGQPGARTWSPWYRDWMTGRLRPVDETTSSSPSPGDDATIGLTADRWALRTGP